MKTSLPTPDGNHPPTPQYVLRQRPGFWEVTFAGRQATFKHELGALYVAYLLLHPPRETIHGVALALHASERFGHPASPEETLHERVMGLEDAASVRTLWRRQRELERVLEDRHEIEPVKAEALRALEEITEHLRQSPWLSRHGAERCALAVNVAIKRLHDRLAAAVDAAGKPNSVLRAFALHLHGHLLLPSGRGGSHSRAGAWTLPGCFIYVPPKGILWEVQSPKPKDQSPESCVQGSGFEIQGSPVQDSQTQRPAAVEYLSLFLCVGFVLALFATGCAAPRPLKGGRAATTRKPAGIVEQTLVQGENPAQATKQSQETVKVRTYTVPAGSRIDQSQSPAAAPAQLSTINSHPINLPEPSTLNPQPSTTFLLSAPMPVVEREESRAGTELGAAQKDTARELGAKLSSLKGIVWVGVGLFVFGLASLVYPPLKVVVASVTTSAAVMAGGLCLMVLPSLIVGNELPILGGVGIAVGGWFIAHRHGQLSGIVVASAGAQNNAPPSSVATPSVATPVSPQAGS
jgi:hypothetical protein